MKSGIKCGEIIWENEEFKFQCFLCEYSDDDLEQFGDHFYASHFKELLNKTTSSNENPLNIPNLDDIDMIDDTNTYKTEIVDIKPESLLTSSKNPTEINKCNADGNNDDDDGNDDFFQDGHNRGDNDDEDSDDDDKEIDEFARFIKNNVATQPTRTKQSIDGQIRNISTCGYCQREFTVREFYLQHIWKWANTRFECSICNEKICGLNPYHNHMRSSHKIGKTKPNNGTIFSCDVCNGKYKSLASIEEHMRIHNGDRPFPCKICKRKFTTQSAADAHGRHQHYSHRSYKCSDCGEEFTLFKLLCAHVKSTHPKPTGPVECKVCSKLLSNKTRLKVHMRTHSNDRPFPCPTCGKHFKCRKTLSSHVTIHSEFKLFPCAHCDMRFNQSSGRRAHTRRVHEKNK